MGMRAARPRDVDAIVALAVRSRQATAATSQRYARYVRNNISKYSVSEAPSGHMLRFVRSDAYAKSAWLRANALRTRRERVDGIDYLVAPVVMVKEQVLNGELLPADEIEKSAPAWNGRPVVVYHPKDGRGRDTIANQPEVVPNYEVGRIFNVEYDPGTTKLTAEIYVDVSKASRKNADTRQALKMIRNSERLEVSTGYIVSDHIVRPGKFDGVEYSAIQRNILPDHLALLPDEIGACSWKDGAGVRNNAARPPRAAQENHKEDDMNEKKKLAMSVIANSGGSLRRGDMGTLLKLGEGALLGMLPAGARRQLRANAGEGAGAAGKAPAGLFGGAAARVNADEEIPIDELVAMTPEEIASAVESIEAPEDLDALEGALLDAQAVIDEAVAIVEDQIAQDAGDGGEPPVGNADLSDIEEPGEEDEDETAAALETASSGRRRAALRRNARESAKAKAGAGAAAQRKNKKELSLNEYLDKMPTEIAGPIRQMMRENKQRKDSLISEIAANESCPFTDRELRGKDIAELEKLHSMLAGGGQQTEGGRQNRRAARQPAANANANYSLARGAAGSGGGKGYIPLTVNIFDKAKKEAK
ncbi:MAG: DUF2213 domain-containing protein [Clostridiales bacterium]|jgi:hypothetical protein|nr:DUF2213 domain-containing protein [Clostridiales bacterium]